MTRERLKLPEQNVREYAHELAERLAREQLAAIDDLQQQCLKSGAVGLSSGKAEITYLNRRYLISLSDGEVSFADSQADVPARDRILLLDYFTRAKGTPLSGRAITYKELHDGLNYYPTFSKRTLSPLVNFFGRNLASLEPLAAAIGGRQADFGDAAVTIDALPHVPVTLVIWRGDEEFPPESSIMFDSTISDYLSNDDIHTLCETIIWTLVRLLKNGGDTAG